MPYYSYGVMVLSIGYHADVAEALAWKISNNLTYPVLADPTGAVTLTYTNLFGSAVLPWDAILALDRVVAYTDQSYFAGNWFIGDILAVFDSLFDPQPAADPVSLNFGEVGVGYSADLPVTLDNVGTGLLIVQDMITNTNAFTASPTQDSIYAVNDSLVVTVTFAPPQYGPYWDTLTVITEAGDLEIPLYGESPDAVAPILALPGSFEVACYPNPFNAELTVQVSLRTPQEIACTLYRADGKIQAELFRGFSSGGTQKLLWTDPTASSGIYLLKVSGEGWAEVKKIALVR